MAVSTVMRPPTDRAARGATPRRSRWAQHQAEASTRAQQTATHEGSALTPTLSQRAREQLATSQREKESVQLLEQVAAAPVAVERGATAPAAVEEAGAATVSLTRLGVVLAWIGATSLGGRSISYLYDELVTRRGWLRAEDFMEGKTAAKVLPGPSGVGTAIFAIEAMHGPRAAAICLIPYLLPSLLIGLAASAFLFGLGRAPWVDGGLRGFSAAALGMVAANSLRTTTGVGISKLPYGPLLIGITFVAHALVGFELLAVLAGVGAVSVALNRPRGGVK